jgi:hypothetical protein
MAGMVLLSGVLLRVGAPWDELWHRLYGVPFGRDLLWPPHLLMYASIALSFVLVFVGLAVALGGRGGLRERFRREPLLAALGLLSAYGFAFIPVDVLWHQVIGPDLVAETRRFLRCRPMDSRRAPHSARAMWSTRVRSYSRGVEDCNVDAGEAGGGRR